MTTQKKRTGTTPRLIGVIHLSPLPGSPGASRMRASDALQQAGHQAMAEAALLQKLGYDAVILENFGDIPFYGRRVPPETVASLSVIAAAVKESVKMRVGVNVLRNDAHAALAIAAVTACDFIRVNVLSGVAASDQGILEGESATLLRERDRLAQNVRIWADIQVKHAQTLSSFDPRVAVEEACARGLADAVIVTGETTGRVVSMGRLKVASSAARRLKKHLYIGSGVTPENLSDLAHYASGVIIGSWIRTDGIAGSALDRKRARKFREEFNRQWFKRSS